jgi:hypothetical protein
MPLSGLPAIELEHFGGLLEVIMDLSFKSLDLFPRPLPPLGSVLVAAAK